MTRISCYPPLHAVSMSAITCPSCGYQFETMALSNRTRCGKCRTVVKVPLEVRRANGYVSGRERRPPKVLVLLLACGHPWPFVDEGIHASEVNGYLWHCDECGASDQEAVQVVGSLSNEESIKLLADEEVWEGWFAPIDPTPVATQQSP